MNREFQKNNTQKENETYETIQELSGFSTVQLSNLVVPSKFYFYSRPKRLVDWMNQDRFAISILKHEINQVDLEAAYQHAAELTESQPGGCSATTLSFSKNRVAVCWLGDSPAFLVGIDLQSGFIQEIIGLNEPHIPLYENDSIIARGGCVNEDGRVDLASEADDQVNNYSLSMSRAFGNSWLGGLLNRKPDFISFSTDTLTKNLRWYAVLGSDGILPESERNLLFPRPSNESLSAQNGIITYCAHLFQELVNKEGKPWLPEMGHWAVDIVSIAQKKLYEMESVTDKQQVGYPTMDDTTIAIISLEQDFSQFSTIVLTVADGHRQGGEITAQKAVDAIHQYFSM